MVSRKALSVVLAVALTLMAAAVAFAEDGDL